MPTEFLLVTSLELDIPAFVKAIEDGVVAGLGNSGLVLKDKDTFSYRRWYPGDEYADTSNSIAIVLDNDPWCAEISSDISRVTDNVVIV
jgi:hypothetical protein